MKNEILAQAMTHIDDALIAEADERRTRGAKITARTLMRNVYRYGAVAACLILAIGVLIAGNIGGQDVLLYGESIEDSPRTVYEYMPLAIVMENSSIPLELEFKKETKLTLTSGSMIVLDENGNTLCEGNEYVANGKVAIIITVPSDTEECIIETDRSYNIVLRSDSNSGVWYVNIEK